MNLLFLSAPILPPLWVFIALKPGCSCVFLPDWKLLLLSSSPQRAHTLSQHDDCKWWWAAPLLAPLCIHYGVACVYTRASVCSDLKRQKPNICRRDDAALHRSCRHTGAGERWKTLQRCQGTGKPWRTTIPAHFPVCLSTLNAGGRCLELLYSGSLVGAIKEQVKLNVWLSCRTQHPSINLNKKSNLFCLLDHLKHESAALRRPSSLHLENFLKGHRINPTHLFLVMSLFFLLHFCFHSADEVLDTNVCGWKFLSSVWEYLRIFRKLKAVLSWSSCSFEFLLCVCDVFVLKSATSGCVNTHKKKKISLFKPKSGSVWQCWLIVIGNCFILMKFGRNLSRWSNRTAPAVLWGWIRPKRPLCRRLQLGLCWVKTQKKWWRWPSLLSVSSPKKGHFYLSLVRLQRT